VRILVNAMDAGSAGGSGVLLGLVPALGLFPDNEVTALVPAGGAERLGAPAGVTLLEQSRSGPRAICRLIDNLVRLPAIARRLEADVLLSLTALGPPSPGCPHVLLLDDPWLAYQLPRQEVRLPLRDRLIHGTWYPARFRRLWPRLARIVVETPVVADRLRARFGVPAGRVAVIPPASTLQVGDTPARRKRVTYAEPLRLFWPAPAYPEKNHAVLAPLCKELLRQGLSQTVRFYVTIDPGVSRSARRLVSGFSRYASMITNLGSVTTADIERWFDRTDALFLPTLLESYGVTYLGAAARCRPILTSDRDFARHACGKAGYYFDPHDPKDIADRIRELIGDMDRDTLRLPDAPRPEDASRSWHAVAGRMLEVLRAAATAPRCDVANAGELRHANG